MIDHLVVATPDLRATVADLTSRLGVELSEGGSHRGMGTRNWLASLGEGRYLEVIGPDWEQPAPTGSRPFGIDYLSHSRLVTWAVSVPDFDAAAAKLEGAGNSLSPIIALSRRLPDGSDVACRLRVVNAGPDGHGGVMPFLVDWGATPKSAHPSATAAPGLELVRLTATHPNPGMVAERLSLIGETLDVAEGQTAALSATIRTPAGDVVLE